MQRHKLPAGPAELASDVDTAVLRWARLALGSLARLYEAAALGGLKVSVTFATMSPGAPAPGRQSSELE